MHLTPPLRNTLFPITIIWLPGGIMIPGIRGQGLWSPVALLLLMILSMHFIIGKVIDPRC